MKSQTEFDMKSETNFHDVLLGILFFGLGQMVLFLGVPRFYVMVSSEIHSPGTGISTSDFPILALQPLMQWLLDTVGALGVSSLLAVVGVGIVVFGWHEFLRDKFD